MNASTIAQKNADRKSKGIRIAADDQVSRNNLPHQYYVTCWKTGSSYLAHTPEMYVNTGECTCPEFSGLRHAGIFCEHIWAAIIYEQAETDAKALAEAHGMTLAQLENHVTIDLATGVPYHMVDRLSTLLHATRRLASEGGER